MDVKNANEELAGSTAKRGWTAEQLSGRYRYKLEKLAGGSFARAVDVIEGLKLDKAEGNSVTRSGMTYALKREDGSGRNKFYVGMDGATPSFMLGFSSGDRNGMRMNEVQLFQIDPGRPDYEYTERIASGNLMRHRNDDRLHCGGFLSLRNVPRFVEAMDFLRPLMPLVAKPDHARKIGDAFLEDADAMRVEDGGLCGQTTLAFAREAQAQIAETVMTWAAVAMPEVNDAMERRGLTWQKSYVNYNDLDNNAFAIPVPDDGQGNPRFALFHENISLISEYGAYIAIGTRHDRRFLGNIELIGLDRSRDDAFAACAAVNSGASEGIGTRIASFNRYTGIVSVPGQIDETGVLESFCFYLGCDHELVAEGLMDSGRYKGDTRIEFDFSGFREEEEEICEPEV